MDSSLSEDETFSSPVQNGSSNSTSPAPSIASNDFKVIDHNIRDSTLCYDLPYPSAHSQPYQSKHRVPDQAYIPLGSLRLKELYQQSERAGQKRSKQTYIVANDSQLQPYPSPELDKLRSKGLLVAREIYNARDESSQAVHISVLPEEAARTYGIFWSPDLRKSLRQMMGCIDRCLAVWNADFDPDSELESTLSSDSDNDSLFYIFNKLKSPPSTSTSDLDQFSADAVSQITNNELDGLKTPLYPYQKRSAALMIRHEVVKRRFIDPRLQSHRGMFGQELYYDQEVGTLSQRPYYYDQPRGGILAETMGYGKTLICLAAILATRGHPAKVPEGRIQVDQKPRLRTSTLLEMAAAKAVREGVPWKTIFCGLKKKGWYHDKCIAALENNVSEYLEPRAPGRAGTRNAVDASDKVIPLSYSNLIIVPPNLLRQWQNEIDKHIDRDELQILVITASTKKMPSASALRKFDVVLITKNRFEQEYRDNDPFNKGPGIGNSPLTQIHWFRVIVDEGHGLTSGAKTNAMAMLESMYVERRWVVSGTPSHSLVGVEVELAANETEGSEGSPTQSTELELEARKESDRAEEEKKDIDKLRSLVKQFLRVQPWSNSREDDYADWGRYIRPFGADGTRRKSKVLRNILQNITIRHRIEDIEAELPCLENKVVYLKPSFYDRLSLNLFISVLASNAVTSERTDEDYMFHKRNRKQLDALTKNLRQSCFHWVGFKSSSLRETIRVSKKYLDEKQSSIADFDCSLLMAAIAASEKALASPAWSAFSTVHEIGVFLDDFPENSRETWCLDSKILKPTLMGVSQARQAQEFVDEKIGSDDPMDGLAGAGIRAMAQARKKAAEEEETVTKTSSEIIVVEEPKIKDQSSSVLKAAKNDKKRNELDESSPVARTKVVGFSSAKLTYLMDRVVELQSSEKVIIFYDTNNVAFWIAEALELLSVRFLIYSNTLTVHRRATYLATFAQKQDFRVLLMDVKQAAHGLHVAAASRVFIVNPIWQSSIESQAIKRAHRIGQTRPVFVETLVLEDTLEDRMLRRRKQMTYGEKSRALKSPLDDQTMEDIIKQEGFLSFPDGDVEAHEMMAKLQVPQQLFGRTGIRLSDESPDEGLVANGDDEYDKKARKRKSRDIIGVGKRSKKLKVTLPRSEPLLSVFGEARA
ncbi:MAG: hypothetical protein Q9160_007882 [Pyrenula sp. 1 TL-2023]